MGSNRASSTITLKYSTPSPCRITTHQLTPCLPRRLLGLGPPDQTPAPLLTQQLPVSNRLNIYCPFCYWICLPLKFFTKRKSLDEVLCTVGAVPLGTGFLYVYSRTRTNFQPRTTHPWTPCQLKLRFRITQITFRSSDPTEKLVS